MNKEKNSSIPHNNKRTGAKHMNENIRTVWDKWHDNCLTQRDSCVKIWLVKTFNDKMMLIDANLSDRADVWYKLGHTEEEWQDSNYKGYCKGCCHHQMSAKSMKLRLTR